MPRHFLNHHKGKILAWRVQATSPLLLLVNQSSATVIAGIPIRKDKAVVIKNKREEKRRDRTYGGGWTGKAETKVFLGS